jgi:ribosome-binding protein aMBF1 (putative translation factor)
MSEKIKAKTDNKVYEKLLKKDLATPKAKEKFERGVALMNLAVQISIERKNRHMSQKQLAENAMMKQQEIARLEKAKHSPTYDTLLKVAHGLGKELHLEFR